METNSLIQSKIYVFNKIRLLKNRNHKSFILLLLLFFCFQLKAYSQRTAADTAAIKMYFKQMARPKKALLFSLVPGGGQFYNHKYWKIPIIYAGFGALTYSFIFYKNEYDRVREIYKQKINGQTITDLEYQNVPEEMIKNIRDSYRKSRDFSIIGMAGLFVLNLMDAAVDAHLKGFDVNENLSFRIKPTYNFMQGNSYIGLNLKLSLK